MKYDLSFWIQASTLAGTVLFGGMRMGSLETRVQGLEARHDQTAEVAGIQAHLDDIQGELKEIRRDIKSLLGRR